MRKLLDGIGLDGRRIQMINVSSAMGGQFAWSAAEMTEEIKRLGPNPLRSEQNGERKTIGETTERARNDAERG